MKTFWCTLAVLALAALTANAFILLAILNRMPTPPVTFGEWRRQMPAAERLKLRDRMPEVEATAYVQNDSLTVKTKEPVKVELPDKTLEVEVINQPLDVHPVRQ